MTTPRIDPNDPSTYDSFHKKGEIGLGEWVGRLTLIHHPGCGKDFFLFIPETFPEKRTLHCQWCGEALVEIDPAGPNQ